ncbi:hypothetical protein PG993_014453 [Apiospora rasikravindrae]|uniref:Uncharacterized protein n=1 Tax=Apiospora rasikravindrae TaxID=990691 RepID=A0ABR1RNX7_9PEZI
MPFTPPTTEPFPQYNEYGCQNMAPQIFGYSSQAYEGASATPDTDIKKPRVLNPEAMEFVSPSRTSKTLTEGHTPLNAGKRITAPLRLTPGVQLPMMPDNNSEPSPAAATPTSPVKPVATPTKQQRDTSKSSSFAPIMSDHKDNNKERKDGDNNDGKSDTKHFASFNESQKSAADSVIPEDKTGQAEEQKSPTKKRPLTKHKQNKKPKSQNLQGTHATENDSGEQVQKESGKKTQTPSDDKPASNSSDKAYKQPLDNSQSQKQDQSGQKGVVPKGTNTKGRSATKEVPDNHPVVPGATWVEGEPKKTKKKNAKRHASKGKPVAKGASGSANAAPTLPKEPNDKAEQDSGSQAASRGDGFEHKAKVNRKAEAGNQGSLEKAVAPAPKAISDPVATASTGTAVETKKRENLASQPNESEKKTSEGSATKPQKEAESSSSTQAKKGKGKKQKASAASQNVTSQDNDTMVPSVVAPATDDAKAERRDTMASLSKADLPLILEDNDKASLPSSGTKTPDLRDAPAPNSSPWKKDGKNMASDKRKEEGASVPPETLREGEERKGG